MADDRYEMKNEYTHFTSSRNEKFVKEWLLLV
jgi:hypothetical protein